MQLLYTWAQGDAARDPSQRWATDRSLDADGQRDPSDAAARGERRPRGREALDTLDQSVRLGAAGDTDVVAEPAVRRGERPGSDDHPVSCREPAERDSVG